MCLDNVKTPSNLCWIPKRVNSQLMRSHCRTRAAKGNFTMLWTGRQLKNTPQHCVSGASFSTDHAMICSHGGLPRMTSRKFAQWSVPWCWKRAPTSAADGWDHHFPRCDDAKARILARSFGRGNKVHFLMLGFSIQRTELPLTSILAM